MKKENRSAILINFVLILFLFIFSISAYVTYITSHNSYIYTDKIRINGKSVTGKTVYETADTLKKWIAYGNTTILKDNKIICQIDNRDFIDASIDTEQLKHVINDQNTTYIASQLNKDKVFDYSVDVILAINQKKLHDILVSKIPCTGETQGIMYYNEKTKAYEVDYNKVQDLKAIERLEKNIIFYYKKSHAAKNSSFVMSSTEDHTDINTTLVQKAYKKNNEIRQKIIIVYRNNRITVKVEDFIRFINGEPAFINGRPDIDNDALSEWLKQELDVFNTLENGHMFDTEGETVIFVSGGNFGNIVDKDETIKAVLNAIEDSSDTCIIQPVFKQEMDRRLDECFVEISKSSQHVLVHKGNDVVFECSCVTGDVKTGKDTHTGVWQILNKETDRYLVGPTWKDWVSYWMPFTEDAQGIHDASWRDEFGGDIYLDNGSHGCVNLSENDAREIFNLVDIGTPIVVY